MHEPVVVGVDADARRIAYATWVNGRISAVSSFLRSNQMHRIDEAYDVTLTRWMARAGEVGARLVLEDIFLSDRVESNVLSFKALAIVQGEILRAARQNSVPAELVLASKWRAAVIGRRGRGREEYKRLALEVASAASGREKLTEHEAEATCIALYGSREWSEGKRA